MSLNNTQWAVLLGGTLLLGGLYVGRTTPLIKKGEQTEMVEGVAVELNAEAVLLDARKALDSTQLKALAELENRKTTATSITDEIEAYKSLSSQWNDWNNYAVGGYYAEKIAELQPAGEAWAIAGTTYSIAAQRNQDVALKRFAARKALHAFEEAIKLEPDTIPHRINEALMYVELSTVDKSVMPMTGAQKMLALDKEYPNNVSINLALGRLSMLRSGDYQKAVKRFENVATLPTATNTDKLESHYMLVECYTQLNQPDKVRANLDACIQLSAHDKALQAEFVRAKKNFENGSQK